MTISGLLIGLSWSVLLALSFQNTLFSISPVDPPTYAAVFLILGATSLVASYLPARRASQVSVVEALRTEEPSTAA